MSPCRKNTISRVGLGTDYCNGDIENLFRDNVDCFTPILPSDSQSSYSKVKTHNGTIWRWIRPVIGENADGSPHIRVEQRVCASSPSTTDDIANIAYYLGLSYQLALELKEGKNLQSFEILRKDFYEACKYGLEAKVFWTNKNESSVRELILTKLIKKAEQGLLALNIAKNDIEFYLNQVLRHRVYTGQTGSRWQKEFMKKTNASFSQMTATYIKNQKADIPVSQWKL